ncbi:dihydrodipicolinate synthase family protein [Ruficoccus amylovorans]|uniref:Dihydrodipicolinate synthase family protein n=1 Tax=Ruficoccus amylovorans TaxID=1804625 RepID=A0A842HD64_9BACT|nr:dihydrodipicolinate synthase family protein [Ruficoccus amylovorans]MBC2593484.1 dihydrodipicolinate synthase family protein [Ruficoccus amylovorans]
METEYRNDTPRGKLVAAMVTPFTKEGSVDVGSTVRLAGWLRSEGVDELFVVGSTGELALLDEKDRLAVIEATRQASGTGTVYAGVSGMGYRHAIRNAKAAYQAGADAVVLMSPFFLALDEEQLVCYCTAVADASPCPVLLYHHLRMPSPFSVPVLKELVRHPNIHGLKDTNGGDSERCEEVLSAAYESGRPDFQFFQGVESLVLRSMRAGATGCVVAQACIAPGLFRSLLDAWGRGDIQMAEAFQERITSLWGVFSEPGVRQSFFHFLRTLKLPLQQWGVIAGADCSLPGVRYAEEFDARIAAFIEAHLPHIPKS